MKYLTPEIIAEVTGGEYVGNDSSRETHVAGAVRDNRDVRPGNLFVCIRGERADGHSFANSAYGAGAACCLAERHIPDAIGPYVLVGSTLSALKTLGTHYRMQFSIPVVGVTGSVGKTSAKEMAAAVLGAKYKVLKTPENLNNEIGVPLTLLSLDESHEAAVIEMGISEFGEMSRLAAMVRPDICIMTNIGYSHLKELGDLDGVLRAKSEVFAYMTSEGVAVMNGDDDLLRGYDPKVRKVTYGLGQNNDFHAENVRTEGTDAVICDIVSGIGRFSITIPAYGRHLVSAALSGAAAGYTLGMTADEIIRGIRDYTPVDGRANVTDTGFITLIDDSYNANPNSVRAALESLAALPGRHVAILGDMLNLGEQSDALHYGIGAFAAESGVASLICCGDSAAFICDGYASTGGKAHKHFLSNNELIAHLPSALQKGDYVLVKASNSMRFAEIADNIRQL